MSDRLSRATKIIFGSGDFGFSLTTTLVAAYFAIFLTDVVGLATTVAAAAIFVGRTWDWVNDPLVGYLSDRTRSRWGRRRPWLLFGAIPFAAVFTLMWWKPPLTGIALAAYYGAAYLIYDAGSTAVMMPYFALTPEITSDYDERTSLTTYRMFFSIAASLVAFIVPSIIVGEFRAQNAQKVLLNGALFGAVSAIPLFLVFFRVREKTEHAQAAQPKLLTTIKAALKNPPLLLGLGIFLFTWVSVDMLQTILLYFLKWIVPGKASNEIIMGTIFVTAMISLPLWNWVSKKMSKKFAYIAGIAFWGVVQIILITLGPGSSLSLLIFLCVLAGIGVGAAHVLPWSILPDAVEWDEWKTGERHEGTFYSLVTLAQKIASSVAIPGALLLLGLLGYVGTAASQPPSAILAIRLITGPIPAALLCLGILCAVLYPINRKLHEQILKELEERKARAGGKGNPTWN
jgi:glycoside/pentoside/hexuronide:cation symporter, GPH family